MAKAKTGSIIQVFKYGQVFDEQIILRDEANNTFNYSGILVNVNTVDQHPAAGGFICTIQDVEKGRLTGAARPHEPNQFSTMFSDIDILQACPAGPKVKEYVLGRERDFRLIFLHQEFADHVA